MNNIGLKQNIEYLEKEYERFKKAGESGYFYDSENCLTTATIFKSTINHLKQLSDSLS